MGKTLPSSGPLTTTNCAMSGSILAGLALFPVRKERGDASPRRGSLCRVYAPAFQDHFLNPRGQGDLADATHRGEATDDACADWMAVALKVEAGRVDAARYRVQGCPGSIAVGSALMTLLPGRPARVDAVGDDELERALGEIPRMKRHALRLARAALTAALASARG